MKRTLDLSPVWQAYRMPGVPTKRLTRDAKPTCWSHGRPDRDADLFASGK